MCRARVGFGGLARAGPCRGFYSASTPTQPFWSHALLGYDAGQVLRRSVPWCVDWRGAAVIGAAGGGAVGGGARAPGAGACAGRPRARERQGHHGECRATPSPRPWPSPAGASWPWGQTMTSAPASGAATAGRRPRRTRRHARPHRHARPLHGGRRALQHRPERPGDHDDERRAGARGGAGGRRSSPASGFAADGWDEGKLAERRHITAADLDAVAPNNPVWLTNTTGHYGVGNSLRDEDRRDPQGHARLRRPAPSCTRPTAIPTACCSSRRRSSSRGTSRRSRANSRRPGW